VASCQSLAGNSGSPLLNQRGEAVGILQANVPYSPEQISAWTPRLLPGESLQSLALATNISCLLSLPWEWSPDCPETDEEEIRFPRVEDFRIAAALPSPHPAFRWDQVPANASALEREITLRPECYLPLEIALLPGQPRELGALVPRVREKIYFNGKMQPRPRLELLEYKEEIFNLGPGGDAVGPCLN
jgi:hypothetical protein